MSHVVSRLRAFGPESDYEALMNEAADEIAALREGLAELAAIAKEWDGESGRAEAYSRTANSELQRRLSIQRAMLLHHHASAIEGCIDRATR